MDMFLNTEKKMVVNGVYVITTGMFLDNHINFGLSTKEFSL